MTPETPIAQEKESKVNIASQELFIEALRSLPIQPEAGDVTFSADGIKLSYIPGRDHIEAEEERYLEQCFEKGIIPYSELKFKYDNYHGIFILDPPKFSVNFLDVSKRREATTKGLLKGGKFNLITFDIGYSGTGTQGFEKFKERFLDSVIEDGYRIQEGDLWITCRYSHSHYNEGLYRDSDFQFAMSGWNRGMHLKLGTKISSEDSSNLVSWFDDIVAKHQPKIEA